MLKLLAGSVLHNVSLSIRRENAFKSRFSYFNWNKSSDLRSWKSLCNKVARSELDSLYIIYNRKLIITICEHITNRKIWRLKRSDLSEKENVITLSHILTGTFEHKTICKFHIDRQSRVIILGSKLTISPRKYLKILYVTSKISYYMSK